MKDSGIFDSEDFLRAMEAKLQPPSVPVPPDDPETAARRMLLMQLREVRPELADFRNRCVQGNATSSEQEFITARLNTLQKSPALHEYPEVRGAIEALNGALRANADVQALFAQVNELMAVSLAAITFMQAAPFGGSRLLPRIGREQRKPRLLIADDDRIVREMMTQLFSNSAELLVACDGGEAHALILKHEPDLAILDDFMPVMTGMKLLEMLAQAQVPVHVMMLTASDRAKDVDRAMNAGVVDYIIKPFDPVDLIAKVKRQLAFM